jgi:co-chaperonin GroES (HSP10)
MRRLIFYSVIALITGISCDKDEISSRQAVTFIKCYGGLAADHGSDVKQLPGGGYFIVGTITVGGNTDVFTLVTDEYGNSKSDLKTFDGINLDDKISKMQLLDDGSAIAIGTLQRTTADKDIWLLRFNSRGDTIWTRTYGKSYGDDEGFDLIVNHSHEIIAVGYTDNLEGGIHDKQIWMHAIDLDGDNIFTSEKSLGFVPRDEVINCVLEVDNGYVLVGSANPKNSGRNILVSKTTTWGGVNRIKDLESESDDQGNMAIQLSDEDFLILGTRTNVSTNTSDILLLKIKIPLNEEQIKILDEKILDDNQNETASCFIHKNNKLHILGTSVESRTDVRKILLIITDDSGNDPQYFKYGFKDIAMEGFGMDYTSDGGFVFTGSNLVLYKIKDSGEL